MKVNAFFELRMNKSEIKLFFILLIWKLWMVHYPPKVEGINFHGILLYRQLQIDTDSLLIKLNNKSIHISTFTIFSKKIPSSSFLYNTHYRRHKTVEIPIMSWKIITSSIKYFRYCDESENQSVGHKHITVCSIGGNQAWANHSLLVDSEIMHEKWKMLTERIITFVQTVRKKIKVNFLSSDTYKQQ